MYRYADTNKLSRPGQGQVKVVTKVRKVTYKNKHPQDDKVCITTEGFEIVEELPLSPRGVAQAGPPQIVGSKVVDRFSR